MPQLKGSRKSKTSLPTSIELDKLLDALDAAGIDVLVNRKGELVISGLPAENDDEDEDEVEDDEEDEGGGEDEDDDEEEQEGGDEEEEPIPKRPKAKRSMSASMLDKPRGPRKLDVAALNKAPWSDPEKWAVHGNPTKLRAAIAAATTLDDAR